MTKLTRFGLSGLFAVATLGVAGCGSDGPPATAKPGSKFCKLAQQARDIGEDVDINSGDPAQLEEQIDAALKAGSAAAAAAPKDFEDLGDATVESQEAVADLLDQYDYDWISAFTSDEGQELFNDPEYQRLQDDRDDYLTEKCELEKKTDNTVSGDIALASGDEGIRQLFQLLAVGGGVDLTDEQVDCAVEALSGNISDEDIAAMANRGTISDEGTLALAQAITDCGIVLPGS